MPGTGASSYNAVATMQATTANTDANAYCFNMEALAGGTSAVFYAAGRFYNAAAGTGTGTLDGNFTGNVGVYGLANSSSAANFGGLFGTLNNAGAGLAATNFSTTADIFRAYDDTSVVVTIKDGGTLRLHAYGAGTLTTDASGNITASSDEALKNVVGEFNEGLRALRKLRPITFGWKHEAKEKDDDGKFKVGPRYTYQGWSAQNVKSTLPGAVGVNADGSLTVQDRAISAVIVNSVKELDLKVEATAASVEDLLSRITRLEKQVTQLGGKPTA